MKIASLHLGRVDGLLKCAAGLHRPRRTFQTPSVALELKHILAVTVPRKKLAMMVAAGPLRSSGVIYMRAWKRGIQLRELWKKTRELTRI
jgi:hypothetical protein